MPSAEVDALRAAVGHLAKIVQETQPTEPESEDQASQAEAEGRQRGRE